MSACTNLKRCTKCRRDFPATPEFFARDTQRKSGLHPHCKACVREWQQSRRAHLDEYRRQYCQQNREREREYLRHWKTRQIINRRVAPLHLRDAGHFANLIRRMVYGDALTAGAWRLERQQLQQISDADSSKMVIGSYAEYLLYRANRLCAVLEVRSNTDAYLSDLTHRLAHDLLRRGWRLDDTRYWQDGAQTHPELNVERVKRLLKKPEKKRMKRTQPTQ